MSRTVNIGIIGTGAIAAKMAQTIRKTRHARLYAVASRDIERAVAFGKTYGTRKAYGSYKELVMDRKVQLVYVATPHTEHYENAKLALTYGKSCLVEKPLAINAQQAKELFTLAKENNLFLSEAMWTRYLPFAQKIRSVLESGVIGTPVSLSASVCENIKDKPRLLDPALGGGTLLDLGIYTLTFASMFFGDDILRINATCSYTDRHVDEQENLALIYKDGRVASLSAGMVGVGPDQGIICGTDGYLVVDNIENFESMSVYNKDHKRIAFYKRPRQKTGYEYEIAACVRAVRAKASETAELPQSQIISILHMMDFARRQFGIVYPCEFPPAEPAPKAPLLPGATAQEAPVQTALQEPEGTSQVTENAPDAAENNAAKENAVQENTAGDITAEGNAASENTVQDNAAEENVGKKTPDNEVEETQAAAPETPDQTAAGEGEVQEAEK